MTCVLERESVGCRHEPSSDDGVREGGEVFKHLGTRAAGNGAVDDIFGLELLVEIVEDGVEHLNWGLGVLHVADGVPENQRAMTLQRELARLARNGTDMRNGQLRRLPMSESEWPNMPYRLLHGLPMKGAIAR